MDLDEDTVATTMIFYTYAILCSQVYLDEFEGALFTVNRADMSPRIPIVESAEVFQKLVSLGNRIAELEKRDYTPVNHMDYDYETIKSKVQPNFILFWSKGIQPFDEEGETITLTDGQ